ncbi:MAG: hypothetical protein WCM93_15885, partial [Bacteroidota bacterium]
GVLVVSLGGKYFEYNRVISNYENRNRHSKNNIMTWKDLWTEFLLKLNIPIKRKLRRVRIPRHDINEFMTIANIIKGRNERDFDDRLNRRSKVTSYLRTDDRLFEPYVDLVSITTIGRENFSFVREIGHDILRTAKRFETDNSVFINKSHLYFGLSLNSLYLSDSINAMIYWELSQQEESLTQGVAFNAAVAINNTVGKFSSVINPVNMALNSNQLYSGLRDNYTFISDFSTVLSGHHTPEVFAYFSSGLRFRQIDYWLQNNFTAMTKIYSQELVNILCILCEANLKNHLAVTQNMFGPIINHDLTNINAAVSAIVGYNHPNPPTGLFVTFPSRTDVDFNTSFPQLVLAIKTNALSGDSLKAHLVYGAYMLRNKSLHDFNPGLVYYNNNTLFLDTIGLLFAAISAIKNL